MNSFITYSLHVGKSSSSSQDWGTSFLGYYNINVKSIGILFPHRLTEVQNKQALQSFSLPFQLEQMHRNKYNKNKMSLFIKINI
jgi:hypothetical protein